MFNNKLPPPLPCPLSSDALVHIRTISISLKHIHFLSTITASKRISSSHSEWFWAFANDSYNMFGIKANCVLLFFSYFKCFCRNDVLAAYRERLKIMFVLKLVVCVYMCELAWNHTLWLRHPTFKLVKAVSDKEAFSPSFLVVKIISRTSS